MIELAGYGYAVGKGTARMTTALLRTNRVTYALYAAFWGCFVALQLGRCSADTTRSVGLLFLIAYLPTILLTACIAVLLVDADKQRVKPEPPKRSVSARVERPSARRRIRRFCRHLRHPRRRIRQWWSETETAAWARSPVCRLAVIVLATAPATLWLADWNVPPVVWLPIVATEIALMLWHLVRLRRLRNRMWDEATTPVDGQLDLYRGFVWDRYDSGDADLFRRRFADVRWKPPTAITDRAEAAIYAQRARNKQSAVSLGAAAIALAVVAVALTPAQAMFQRLVTFSTPPPPDPDPDPDIKQLTIWAACFFALLYPAYLKDQSRKMGELAKIYEDRCDTLGNETSPAESDPQPAADPVSRGTVIRIGRRQLEFRRIDPTE